MLGKTDLTIRDMIKMLMQNAKPISTRESTERLVKILDSTYTKSDIEQVADNSTHLNAEERNQLLRLLQGFDDLVDGTLG